MAIAKQFLKSKPECKVKFTLAAADAGNAESVTLVGDFNNWEPSATPMKKQKNGDFSVTLNFPADSVQKFRYLADNERWLNEAEADRYEHCAFAQAENSVIQL